jgi:hypothetical protein
VPTTFTERLSLQHRHELAEGVTFLSTAGLGLNRAGTFLQTHPASPGAESPRGSGEESLFFHENELELRPTEGLSLRLSSRVSRQVAITGALRQRLDAGLIATIHPADETSVYAGAYRSYDLNTDFACTVLTGGLETKLHGTPFTLTGSGWAVLAPVDGRGESDESWAGASAAISWQAGKCVWQTAGVDLDESRATGAQSLNWRSYFSTAWQTSADVSIGLEFSYAAFSSEALGAAAREHLSETRVRVSRRRRIMDNFATEMSVEWAMGDLVRASADGRPAVRLAGEFLF